MLNSFGTDQGSYSTRRSGSWRVRRQSSILVVLATILALFGSQTLWKQSRALVEEATEWTSIATNEAHKTSTDIAKSKELEDKIEYLDELVYYLNEETDLEEDEVREIQDLVTFLRSIEREQQEHDDASCQPYHFCNIWIRFRDSPDTEHWEKLLANIDAVIGHLELVELALQSRITETEAIEIVEQKDLYTTEHDMENLEESIDEEITTTTVDRKRAKIYLKKSRSKAIHATWFALISLLFVTAALLRLVSGCIFSFSEYKSDLIAALGSRQIMLAMQNALIWIEILALLNQYLHEQWNPVWVIIATAIVSGSVQFVHTYVFQLRFTADSSWSMKLSCFMTLAFIHTLAVFFLFGELVTLDWHIRMALFALLVLTWTYQNNDHITSTVATTQESPTIATETSSLYSTNKGFTHAHFDRSIVYLGDLSTVSGWSGWQPWAMISWDALVVCLGFRIICLVYPIGWQVSPTATLFAEALAVLITALTIRTPTNVDESLPRTICVQAQ